MLACRFILIALLYMLSYPFPCRGGEPDPDSLRKKLTGTTDIDTTLIAQLNQISTKYRDTNPAKAILYSQLALDLSEKIKWNSGTVKAYYYTGSYYLVLGDYEKAFLFLFKGLNLARELGYKKWQGMFYGNIGTIYNIIEKPDLAIHYYRMSGKILEELHLNKMHAIVLIFIGQIYKDKDSLKTALPYFYKSLILTDDKISRLRIYIEMGDLYGMLGEYEKALGYEYRALAMLKDTQLTVYHISAYRNLGKIYLKTGKYNQAASCLKKAEDIAVKIKATGNLKWVYPVMISLYEKTENFKNAFYYYRRLDIIKDSLQEENAAEKIERVQNRYKGEQAQQQIRLLSKENEIKDLKLRRNSYLAGGLGLLVITGTVFGVFFVKHNKLKERQKALQFEQRALRAQMNPHFLFNSLNSIQKFILNHDVENGQEYVSKFALLVRKIFENSDQLFIPISDEIEALRLYLEIEQFRLKDKFLFTITVDPDLDIYNCYMPSMLLQPFVENSIWHGIMNKENTGQVNVSVRASDARISFLIEDDGIGREASERLNKLAGRKHAPSGLRLAMDRIKGVSTLSRKNITVSISDRKDLSGEVAGTEVEIQIPKTFDNGA